MSTTVTLIPGMFGPLINTFLGTYFIDQMEYLEKHGVSYDVMPVDSQGILDKNANIIREKIQDKNNVVAFCHSKGGIDLLHALILFPEIRPKFRKIFFMQCPFYGTPLADMAFDNGATALAATGIFKFLLRGDATSAKELSKASRERYMTEHETTINALLASLDIECIGSSKQREPGRFDSILKLSRDLMDLKYSLPNDGMIPTESAFIRGAKRISFEDLDHASAVIRLTPQEFDRVAFSHQIFHGYIQ